MVVISPLVERLMHLDTLRDAEPALAGQQEISEPAAPELRTDLERKP